MARFGNNIWNTPKYREVLESAILEVAKVFDKEDEFEAFIKARAKLLAMNHVQDRQSYKIRKQESLQSTPPWLEPIALTLAKLYEEGMKAGRNLR